MGAPYDVKALEKIVNRFLVNARIYIDNISCYFSVDGNTHYSEVIEK